MMDKDVLAMLRFIRLMWRTEHADVFESYLDDAIHEFEDDP